MNPYSYPKTRHSRTQFPRDYATYRAYKPYLQKEFGARCVYCRQPDGPKGYASFGVDHYRPKTLFPERERLYTNLFYSCSTCNTRKGPYWPSDADLAKLFIPNPCDHAMFEHLRYKEATVISRSPAGEVAIAVLDLNAPTVVQYRETMLHLIELQEADIAKLRGMADKLKARKVSGAISEADYISRLQRIDNELAKGTAALGMLDGTIPAQP